MFNRLMDEAVAAVMPFVPEPRCVVELGDQRLSKALLSVGIDNTPAYYRSIGFGDYIAIDLNGGLETMVADLNQDPRSWASPPPTGTLITNNGTSEHIFDQARVLRTMHELCRPGGVMLHSVPMLPWVNHGFYNYTPVLFRDLAHANNYQVVLSWIGRRNGERFHLDLEAWGAAEKNPDYLEGRLTEFGSKGGLLIVVGYVRNGLEPFATPTQRKYAALGSKCT